jgi:hypothetical protein
VDTPGDAIASIFMMVLAASGYLLPAIIAKCRNHYNKGAIFVLTLLGGWTLIGWGIAMVWAMMRSPARPAAPTGKVYPDCPDSKAKRFFEQSLRSFVQHQRPPELTARDVEYDIACMTALAVNNFHWLYDGQKNIIDAMTKDQFMVLNIAIGTTVYFTWLWQLQHPTTS